MRGRINICDWAGTSDTSATFSFQGIAESEMHCRVCFIGPCIGRGLIRIINALNTDVILIRRAFSSPLNELGRVSPVCREHHLIQFLRVQAGKFESSVTVNLHKGNIIAAPFKNFPNKFNLIKQFALKAHDSA